MSLFELGAETAEEIKSTSKSTIKSSDSPRLSAEAFGSALTKVAAIPPDLLARLIADPTFPYASEAWHLEQIQRLLSVPGRHPASRKEGETGRRREGETMQRREGRAFPL